MKKKGLILAVLIVISAVIVLIAVTLNSQGTSQKTPKKETVKVTIGHAICDENGEKYGGKAGDQTGSEVYTRSYYPSAWNTVFRAKSPEAAEKIASAMEAACKNDKIGYDQYQRTTLYECAKAADWDLSEIDTECETDCSALVSVCVNAAGIELSKDAYTGNLQEHLLKTEQFDLFTDSEYTQKADNLKRGDIILKKGHCVIVLSNSA